VLAQLTDFNIYACICMMGALCALYTVHGGMEVVVWTDVVQSILLLGSAILSIIFDHYEMHRRLLGILEHSLQSRKVPYMGQLYRLGQEFLILLGYIFREYLCNTCAVNVRSGCSATIYDHSERKASCACNLDQCFVDYSTTLVFLTIGTCLWYYFGLHPEQLDSTRPVDSKFPQFIVKVMPAGLMGLVIAGIFAAAQSTVSGTINSVATALVTDFAKCFHPTMPDLSALRLARWLTGVLGVFATLGAVYIAYFNNETIWDKYIALIGLVSSGLAGLFLLGIATCRTHALGALFGVGGSAVVLAGGWKYSDLHPHLYAAIGVLTCVTVGYLASILIPRRQKDLTGLTIHTRKKDSPQKSNL
jgi:solute:Na+ symporter, SSS family